MLAQCANAGTVCWCWHRGLALALALERPLALALEVRDAVLRLVAVVRVVSSGRACWCNGCVPTRCSKWCWCEHGGHVEMLGRARACAGAASLSHSRGTSTVTDLSSWSGGPTPPAAAAVAAAPSARSPRTSHPKRSSSSQAQDSAPTPARRRSTARPPHARSAVAALRQPWRHGAPAEKPSLASAAASSDCSSRSAALASSLARVPAAVLAPASISRSRWPLATGRQAVGCRTTRRRTSASSALRAARGAPAGDRCESRRSAYSRHSRAARAFGGGGDAPSVPEVVVGGAGHACSSAAASASPRRSTPTTLDAEGRRACQRVDAM